MKSKPKQLRLHLGNIYAIDWLDHYYADRIRADAAESPVVNRTYGKLTEVSPRYLRLEFCRQISDDTPSTTVSYFKILRTDIVDAQDFGRA